MTEGSSDGSVLAKKLENCLRIATAWDVVNDLCNEIRTAGDEVTNALGLARNRLGEAQRGAERELGHAYRTRG